MRKDVIKWPLFQTPNRCSLHFKTIWHFIRDKSCSRWLQWWILPDIVERKKTIACNLFQKQMRTECFPPRSVMPASYQHQKKTKTLQENYSKIPSMKINAKLINKTYQTNYSNMWKRNKWMYPADAWLVKHLKLTWSYKQAKWKTHGSFSNNEHFIQVHTC